jgi:hypothetical protein
LANSYSVPCLFGLSDELVQTHALALVRLVPQDPPSVEQGHESMDVCVLFDIRPIEPTNFIVLTIGIVIPKLAMPRRLGF